MKEFKEHDVVVTIEVVMSEFGHIPAGSSGAIVAIYGDGKGFEVEFNLGAIGYTVVTLRQGQFIPETP